MIFPNHLLYERNLPWKAKKTYKKIGGQKAKNSVMISLREPDGIIIINGIF